MGLLISLYNPNIIFRYEYVFLNKVLMQALYSTQYSIAAYKKNSRKPESFESNDTTQYT